MTRPDPAQCCQPSHLGRLHHDTDEDIWYECVSDERRGVITWAALETGLDCDSYVQPVYDGGMASKTERLNLRLTATQDAVLRRAADAKGEAVSDYVLRHAVEAAEADLADRRVFVVDEAAWDELQAVLNQPPKPAPALRKLLSTPSVLEPS